MKIRALFFLVMLIVTACVSTNTGSIKSDTRASEATEFSIQVSPVNFGIYHTYPENKAEYFLILSDSETELYLCNRKGQFIKRIVHDTVIEDFSLSPDYQYLSFFDAEGKVFVLDADTNETVFSFLEKWVVKGNGKSSLQLDKIEFSGAGDKLLVFIDSADGYPECLVYDFINNRKLESITLPGRSNTLSDDYSQSNDKILFLQEDDIFLYDINGRKKATYKLPDKMPERTVSNIRWVGDTDYFIVRYGFQYTDNTGFYIFNADSGFLYQYNYPEYIQFIDIFLKENKLIVYNRSSMGKALYPTIHITLSHSIESGDIFFNDDKLDTWPISNDRYSVVSQNSVHLFKERSTTVDDYVSTSIVCLDDSFISSGIVNSESVIRKWNYDGSINAEYHTTKDVKSKLCISFDQSLLAVSIKNRPSFYKQTTTGRNGTTVEFFNESELVVLNLSLEEVSKFSLDMNLSDMKFTKDNTLLCSGFIQNDEGYKFQINEYTIQGEFIREFHTNFQSYSMDLETNPLGYTLAIFTRHKSPDYLIIWDEKHEIIFDSRNEFDNNIKIDSYALSTERLILDYGLNTFSSSNGFSVHALHFDLDSKIMEEYNAPGFGEITAIDRSGKKEILYDHQSGKVFEGEYPIDDKDNELINFSGKFIDIKISPDGNYVVGLGDDGRLNVISLSSQESIKMVSDSSGWISYTPDGFFTCTPEILSRVFAVRGKTVYSLNQLALIKNRPDIIIERMGSHPQKIIDYYYQLYTSRLERNKIEIDQNGQITMEVPIAEIVDFSQKNGVLSLNMSFESENSLLSQYQIYINGSPLFVPNGKLLNDSNAEITEIFELNNGINTIEVSCINENGIESYKESITIESDAYFQENLYFVGIGISDYVDENLKLKYAAKDIIDVSKIIQSENMGRFDNIYLKTLTDSEISFPLDSNFGSFLSSIGPHDTLIFYVAGHGAVLDNNNPEFNYLLSDFSLDTKSTIAMNEFYLLFANINCQNKLMLIDTCQSGKIIDANDYSVAVLNANSKLTIKNARGLGIIADPVSERIEKEVSDAINRLIGSDIIQSSGLNVFSSSLGTELSFESDIFENGLFWKIRSKHATHSGFILPGIPV